MWRHQSSPPTPCPCIHQPKTRMLFSLLTITKITYSYDITSSLRVVVTVGIFSLRQYPCHKINLNVIKNEIHDAAAPHHPFHGQFCCLSIHSIALKPSSIIETPSLLAGAAAALILGLLPWCEYRPFNIIHGVKTKIPVPGCLVYQIVHPIPSSHPHPH